MALVEREGRDRSFYVASVNAKHLLGLSARA
jgi:hypothetical protein